MERKLELGMEGVRFYDLARWGGAVMRSEVQSYIDYDAFCVFPQQRSESGSIS